MKALKLKNPNTWVRSLSQGWCWLKMHWNPSVYIELIMHPGDWTSPSNKAQKKQLNTPPPPKIVWGEITFLCECVLNLRKLLRFVEIKRRDSQRDYIHDFQSVSDPGIKAQSYFCCSFYKCFQGIKALYSSWILSLQMANIHYLIGGLSNVMETQLATYALTIEICASIIQEEICVCHVWHLWKLNLRLHSKFWHVVLLLLL